MSKAAAAKTVESIEFPAFDADKASDQVRAFAEKSLDQSKEAFTRFKTGAEQAQKLMETSFERARTTGSELSLKTIAALRANTEAGFSHLEALLAVKSLSEAIELQTAFVRKSVETAVEQAKDFQATSAKAVDELSKPVKDIFEKSVKELKAA